MIRLILPIDIYPLSPNALTGRHFRAVNRLRKDAKDLTGWKWIEAGKPTISGPVVVNLHICRARKMDEDNTWAACKPIFDVLFKGAITENDSPRFVRLGNITWQHGAQFKTRPELHVTVISQSEMEQS